MLPGGSGVLPPIVAQPRRQGSIAFSHGSRVSISELLDGEEPTSLEERLWVADRAAASWEGAALEAVDSGT